MIKKSINLPPSADVQVPRGASGAMIVALILSANPVLSSCCGVLLKSPPITKGPSHLSQASPTACSTSQLVASNPTLLFRYEDIMSVRTPPGTST
jgi:hypothetical protein